MQFLPILLYNWKAIQHRETRIGIPAGEIFPANPIRQWAERGYTNEAVALYGTSAEVIRDIAQTGIVPSFPRESMLPYMRLLVGRNRHLYFFYPVIEQARIVNPQLMERYYPCFAGWTREQVDEELSIEEVKSTARNYAAWKTLNNAVKRYTGISVDSCSILHVSYDLLPQETKRRIGGELWGDKEDSRENSDPEEVAQLMSFPNRELLVQALHEGLNRQGVLVYFKSALFFNRALPGYEDEHELLVVSPQSLKADVISGIEVLSEADREILGV